jgi:hypothetical protein
MVSPSFPETASPSSLAASATTKWRGAVSLDGESFEIALELVTTGAAVTGILQVFDPVRQRFVFLGNLTGSRTGDAVALATQEGIQLVGTLAGGQVAGDMTFPPNEIEAGVVAPMTLTLTEGSLYQLFVPLASK